ncbi:MAG: VWA domain-containing protein [Vicinamibacterales bacterium]
MSALLANLIRFGAVLRAAGLDVPAAAMIDVASALRYVDIGRRADFFFTLRALLVHRPQDLALFEEAFRAFWRPPSRDWSPHDLRAMGEQRRIGPPEQARGEGATAGGGDAGSRVESTPQGAPFSHGAGESLRTKDFALFTDEELRRAREMLDALEWRPDRRRTRRWQAAAGTRVDLRRLVAEVARRGDAGAGLPTRGRRWRERPLVLICDVSGSMERYVRMLLQFAHGLVNRGGQVEAFVFATRLTRITRSLTRRGPDEAVSRVLGEVRDYGGGTRIGDALRAYNLAWARRVGGRGPVVLLVSDGWDRGEPLPLAREMARLARGARRVVWLNPLLGSPDYQPLTRGMQAALPFVDDFLPIHNFVSLEMLARHLNALPPSRGGRRRSGPSSSDRPSRGGAGRRAPSGRPPGPRR